MLLWYRFTSSNNNLFGGVPDPFAGGLSVRPTGTAATPSVSQRMDPGHLPMACGAVSSVPLMTARDPHPDQSGHHSAAGGGHRPVGDQSSRFPAPFTLDGSASFHQDPAIPIVERLWDWDASNGVDWNSPNATGPTPLVNPGWIVNGPRTVTLRVKDNQNPANTATATIIINVTANDIAPTALAMPPSQVPQIYSGNLGDTIVLDGSASFDVDGDVIESYSWDLNGDGQYGTAADIALDTSGFNAAGSTASVVYLSANNSQVGLRVCSTPRNADGIALGPQKCGTSTKPVDVYASLTDLHVSSLTAANLNPTVSADISATLSSAAGSAAFNNVVVRFYKGNPLTGGVQVGASYQVNIPAGGSVVLNVPGFLLSGTSLLWAFVDANNLVPEYNEANNTANVNVANQPPVARAQDVTVSANGNCQGAVTAAQVNNGSSDPDNDPLTFTLNPAGPFALGDTLVTLTVSDGKVSSTATATVTVKDLTPPQIACPADISVSNDPGVCGAVVNYTAPAGTDNCPGATLSGRDHGADDGFAQRFDLPDWDDGQHVRSDRRRRPQDIVQLHRDGAGH